MPEKKRPYKINHPLGDQHLKALGMVAVEAAQTEALLELLISKAIGIDVDRARAITIPLSMSQRINLLSGLVIPYLDDNERQVFSKLLGALRSANSDRNDCIHAYWIEDVEKQIVATKRDISRGKINFRSRADLTAKQVEAIAKRLQHASTDLFAFVQKINPSERAPTRSLLAELLMSANESMTPRLEDGLFGYGALGLLGQPRTSEE